MQYALQVFETEDHFDFRILDRDGEPWFVLADVCRSLLIANPRDAATRLDDDERDAVGIADAIGRQQSQTVINESGLYKLIFTSRTEKARAFKKWVTSVVLPKIHKTGSFGNARQPLFLQRYSANHNRVSAGHFSVIQVLATHLYGPMEFDGHQIADLSADGKEIRPENSVGRLFSDWLKKHHPEVKDNYSYYIHWTPQKEFPARQYPNEMYGLFVQFLQERWIPECTTYFRSRDPGVLPHLPKLLPANDAKAGMMKSPTLLRRQQPNGR